jgi:VWFA-related protein
VIGSKKQFPHRRIAATNLCAIICLHLCIFTANAQQQPFPLPPTAGPVAAAAADTTRKLFLDVFVADKSGKPVPGLQQQDFTLLDNKQPTKITDFFAVDEAAAADAPVEIILLLDRVNTAFSANSNLQQQLEKYLKQNNGQLSRPVSIISVTDSETKIMPATRDGNVLATSLEQYQSGLRQITRSEGAYGAVERVELSLRALHEVSAYGSKRPGRKLLIWLSPGWPTLSGPRIQLSEKDQRGIFNSIVVASDDLRHARISLYSIDPRGVSSASTIEASYYKEFLKGVTTAKKSQFGNLALQVLAEQSGGKVFFGSNDLPAEIERCLSDLKSWYVLTFASLPGDGPNEYHALDVKIDKPGVLARTRAGYYAQP